MQLQQQCHDNCQVKLFLRRICADWDKLSEKMRKALTYRDGVALHINCGMFLHFLDALQKRAPNTEFPGFKEKLLEQFLSGMMDPELTTCAENSVPPGEVTGVGAFRHRGQARFFFSILDCSQKFDLHLFQECFVFFIKNASILN